MIRLDAAVNRTASTLTTAIDALVENKIKGANGSAAPTGAEVEELLKKFAQAILEQARKQSGAH